MKSLVESIKNSQMEFVIIKPGFIGQSAEIIGRLEALGIVPYRLETKQLTFDVAKELYKMHRKEDFYEDLCKYMSSDCCIGMMCTNVMGVDMDKVKDKIRHEFGKDDMKNAIHSSDSSDNMDRESKIFFDV